MLDPSGINFKDLPSVAIENRHQLPDLPCIYFAIDGEDRVQYIGRASSAKKRWRSHHRRKQLEKIGGIRIMYLEVPEASLLPSIESALIDYFSPFLNRAIVLDPPRAGRSHLHHPLDEISGAACGSSSDRVFSRLGFLGKSNRCERCDRLAQGLKTNTGGGRPGSKGLKFTIVLSHLTPEALDRLQRLAAEGKAGETIGLLVNENTEQLGDRIMDTKYIDIKEMEAKALNLISLGEEYFEICKRIAQVSTVDEFIEPFIGDEDPIGDAISSVIYHLQANSEAIPKDFTKALRSYLGVNQTCVTIGGGN